MTNDKASVRRGGRRAARRRRPARWRRTPPGAGLVMYMQMGGNRRRRRDARPPDRRGRRPPRRSASSCNEQFSAWAPETMINQFKEAMAAKPNCIEIMGHPGSAAFHDLVEQAVGQGIVVTVGNSPMTDLQEEFGANGTRLCRRRPLCRRQAHRRGDAGARA